MNKISNSKFLIEQHASNAGVSYLSDLKNWEILGWCESPPADSFNKGFAVLFECIKNHDDIEAGTKVWFHYDKKSLSEFGIVTESLGTCKHVEKGGYFLNRCSKKAKHVIVRKWGNSILDETPFCEEHAKLRDGYNETVTVSMYIKE